MRRPDAEAGARGAWIAGLAVTVIAVVVSLQVPLLGGLWNDDGVYLVLGRALAAGQGYHAIHIPGEPFHIKFPPGWPLVLSVFWAMSRSLATVLVLARTWNVLAVGATAALLWRLACGQRRLPAMLVVAFAIMPLLLDANLELAAIPTSEPTFLLLWVLSLVLWNGAFSVPEGERNRRNVVAFGLAAGATALVRGPGVVVVASALVALACVGGPRRPRLVAACATLLPPLLWTGYAFLAAKGQPLSGIPDDRSYQTYLIALVRDGGIPGVIDRMSDHATEMGRTAAYHVAHRPLGALLVACVVLCGIAGVIRLARRDPYFSMSVAGMLLVVVAWPFPQFRLLLPIVPLLGVAAGSVLAPLTDRLPPGGRLAIHSALLAGIVMTAWRQFDVRAQGLQSALSGRGLPVMSPAYVLRVNAAMLGEIVPWVEQHTMPDDHLMTPLASAVFLQTGRQAVPADVAGRGDAAPSSASYLLERIRRDRLNWVLTPEHGAVGGAEIRAVEQECPGLLRRTDSLHAVLVYAVDQANACAVGS